LYRQLPNGEMQLIAASMPSGVEHKKNKIRLERETI